MFLATRFFTPIIVILVMVITAAVGYTGLMVWQDRAEIEIQNSKPAVYDELTEDRSAIETPFPGEPNASKVDTSDWKTYRSDDFGFEVRYPEDWVVNQVQGWRNVLIEIASVDKSEYLPGIARLDGVPPKGSAWVTLTPDFNSDVPNGKRQVTLTKEIVVIETLDVLTSTDNSQRISVVRGYWWGEPDAANYEQIFNQILSTFRFLE